MKRIYLACPYFHNDRNIMEQRFNAVNEKAGQLMRQGYIVFSPISHSVPIDNTFIEHEMHDFWLKQDKEFIDWADELWVFSIDGWKESKGVKWEMDYAYKKAIPVRII